MVTAGNSISLIGKATVSNVVMTGLACHSLYSLTTWNVVKNMAKMENYTGLEDIIEAVCMQK